MRPPIAQTTKVPNTVKCECEMTKSEKWVGCCIERNASSEPWQQPARYMTDPMIRNLAGRFLATPSHLPLTVPKKLARQAHTRLSTSVHGPIATVSAQSAIGL